MNQITHGRLWAVINTVKTIDRHLAVTLLREATGVSEQAAKAAVDADIPEMNERSAWSELVISLLGELRAEQPVGEAVLYEQVAQLQHELETCKASNQDKDDRIDALERENAELRLR